MDTAAAPGLLLVGHDTSCPANMLGYLLAIRLVLTGAPSTLPSFRAKSRVTLPFPRFLRARDAVEESLLDVRFRHSKIEERFLDY